MKKYYINGQANESEALSLDELKSKGLLPSDYVWFEGLDDWKLVAEIEELEPFVKKVTTPPPFPQQNQIVSANSELEKFEEITEPIILSDSSKTQTFKELEYDIPNWIKRLHLISTISTWFILMFSLSEFSDRIPLLHNTLIEVIIIIVIFFLAPIISSIPIDVIFNMRVPVKYQNKNILFILYWKTLYYGEWSIWGYIVFFYAIIWSPLSEPIENYIEPLLQNYLSYDQIENVSSFILLIVSLILSVILLFTSFYIIEKVQQFQKKRKG